MGLMPDDVERLDAIVKRNRPLHRGDHLFRQDDGFHSLLRRQDRVGEDLRAERRRRRAGAGIPSRRARSSASTPSLENRHGCSAKVLETSAVCELPFDRLEELAASVPSLQHQLYRLMSKEIGDETHMLMLLGKKNAEERLAAFLLSLSNRFKRRGFSAMDFYLSMSRHEIGSYLGLAVETVSRLFTRFQEQGLVRVERKHIQIIDRDALEALVAGQQNQRDQQQRPLLDRSQGSRHLPLPAICVLAPR